MILAKNNIHKNRKRQREGESKKPRIWLSWIFLTLYTVCASFFNHKNSRSMTQISAFKCSFLLLHAFRRCVDVNLPEPVAKAITWCTELLILYVGNKGSGCFPSSDTDRVERIIFLSFCSQSTMEATSLNNKNKIKLIFFPFNFIKYLVYRKSADRWNEPFLSGDFSLPPRKQLYFELMLSTDKGVLFIFGNYSEWTWTMIKG